jgi:hypothetical protein
MTKDIFDYLKSVCDTQYSKVYDTALAHDTDNKPIDNVCTIRFGLGEQIRRLCGGGHTIHPVQIITRGSENPQVSRTIAESISIALNGVNDITQGTTHIIYITASAVQDEGITAENTQAYHTIDLVVQYD